MSTSPDKSGAGRPRFQGSGVSIVGTWFGVFCSKSKGCTLWYRQIKRVRASGQQKIAKNIGVHIIVAPTHMICTDMYTTVNQRGREHRRIPVHEAPPVLLQDLI